MLVMLTVSGSSASPGSPAAAGVNPLSASPVLTSILGSTISIFSEQLAPQFSDLPLLL